MFFVMSGFLITAIILKEKEKNTFSFKQYYLSRTLRIFPIYYLTIILVAIFISTEHLIYPVFYVSNYFFSFHNEVHPLNNTWTLAVEEHFYLIWPIILSTFSIKMCKYITGYIIPAIAILTVIILGLVFEPDIASNLACFGTTTRCISISFGSFLAFNYGWLKNLSTRGFKKIILLCIAVYGLFYFMPLIPVLNQVPQYVRLVCIVPVISTLLIIISHRANFIADSVFKRVVFNSPIAYVGLMSYGLYLYHYPIFYYFGITDWQTPVTSDVFTYWLAVAITFIFSILSFHFIETPVLNLRKKFSFGKTNKQAPGTLYTQKEKELAEHF